MKHKMVLFLVLGMICVPLIYASSTYGSQNDDFEMLHDHLEKVAKELKITEPQKISIHDIVAESHEKMATDIHKLAEGHKEMLDLIHKEQFDEAAFRAAFRKNSSALEEVVLQGARGLHQVRGVLTSGQRDKLKEMIRPFHSKTGNSRECPGAFLKNLIKHVHGN